MARLFRLLVLLAPLVACQSVTPPGILVSSDPPGAKVLRNGRDTGFVTPCYLDVGAGRLEIRLPGYRPALVRLEGDLDVDVVPWEDGEVPEDAWAFPLFLPAEDLFLPFKVDTSPRPSRIHVDLRLDPGA